MKEKRKPFVTIQNRENKEMFWVPKPTASGNMHCVAGFNLMRYLPFVDAVNNLEYAEVVNTQVVDSEMSFMLVKLTKEKSFGQFTVDIAELIYKHVEMATPTPEKHLGTKNEADGYN